MNTTTLQEQIIEAIGLGNDYPSEIPYNYNADWLPDAHGNQVRVGDFVRLLQTSFGRPAEKDWEIVRVRDLSPREARGDGQYGRTKLGVISLAYSNFTIENAKQVQTSRAVFQVEKIDDDPYLRMMFELTWCDGQLAQAESNFRKAERNVLMLTETRYEILMQIVKWRSDHPLPDMPDSQEQDRG